MRPFLLRVQAINLRTLVRYKVKAMLTGVICVAALLNGLSDSFFLNFNINYNDASLFNNVD